MLIPVAVSINPHYITASGVVLRGSGSGTSPATNTVITQGAASTSYPLIVLGSSSAAPAYTSGTITSVTDSYVPAGSLTLDVSNGAGYSAGESVMIKRPTTTNWINFMGMNSTTSPTDTCSGTCNWISVSTAAFKTDRVITAMSSPAAFTYRNFTSAWGPTRSKTSVMIRRCDKPQ